MHSNNKYVSRAQVLALLCTAALAAGCTVSEQGAPPLAGPSGFGVSLTVTAAPQLLPRDGASMSTVSVTVLNPDGSPRANQRLALKTDGGILSLYDVLTGSNGTATVTFVAPSINEAIDVVTITAVPVEVGDFANNSWNQGYVHIRVVGPDVPVANFANDAPKAILQLVTFDASAGSNATTLGGKPCLSACTYSWDFGDGSTGSDLVVQHQYSNPGVFNVTLTATSKASGASQSVTRPVVITLPGVTTPEFLSAPCASGGANCKAFTDNSVPADGVTIVSRLWDFGDGTSPEATTDQIISHTFPTNANTVTYNVRLRLTDNFGRVTSTTQQVGVP